MAKFKDFNAIKLFIDMAPLMPTSMNHHNIFVHTKGYLLLLLF